jgi:mono/diheme cytochrome c family protein
MAKRWFWMAAPLFLGIAVSASQAPTPGAPAGEVTFTRDVARILQRSCQECHHVDGVAPMPLVTYEDVRPWARSIKTRTGLRSLRGAMPPFFVEKNIGIQKFKHDPSLTEAQIAKIGQWADSGAPRGNPADMPKPLDFDETDKWTIGEPDLILRSKDVTVPAIGPDKWGDFGLMARFPFEPTRIAASSTPPRKRSWTTSPAATPSS